MGNLYTILIHGKSIHYLKIWKTSVPVLNWLQQPARCIMIGFNFWDKFPILLKILLKLIE